MTDEIIERAKIIAGIDGDDAVLSLYAEDAVQYVIAYCHLEILPQKLYGITAQLAADAYKRGGESGIASLKEGDRQINYTAFDSVIESFAKRLRPFVNCSGRVPSEVVRNV